MKTKIKSITLILIVAFALCSCSTTRTSQVASHKTEQNTANYSAEQAVATLESTTTTDATTDAGQSNTALLYEEAVPAEQTSVNATVEDLANLPSGAAYSSQNGRAGVSMTKEPDGTITATSQCDEIARKCIYYESEAFRLQNELNIVVSQLESLKKKNHRPVRHLYSQTTRAVPLSRKLLERVSNGFYTAYC